VAEISQIEQREQKITELEANLEYAYQLIKHQQEQIIELQELIAPNKNQIYQQQSILIEHDISLLSKTKLNSHTVTGESQNQSKKHGKQLSRLQFSTLVTGVVLLITLIWSALNRRQNPFPSEPVAKPSVTVPQIINKLPPLPVLSSVPLEVPPFPEVRQENLELAYNVKITPNYHKTQKLQAIVDAVISVTAANKLPLNPLSVTLIDIKNGNYAEYQQEKPRFPASVVKMFWMVDLYAQIENGIWHEADFIPYLSAMIKKSDNNAASNILDAITKTKSGHNLEGEKYEIWLNGRKRINDFFQKAGYKKININQKTFPITKEKIYEPQGSDLKMRGDPKDPIRNKITTQQAARLLYEIYNRQAISPSASVKMANLLSIDPGTRLEKQNQQNPDEFNPVRGYLSESLPTDVYFGGKAGWTSGSRQEAAYIATPDGKAAYILVIFAEDRAYAYDWKIFPQISRLVFDRMTKGN